MACILASETYKCRFRVGSITLWLPFEVGGIYQHDSPAALVMVLLHRAQETSIFINFSFILAEWSTFVSKGTEVQSPMFLLFYFWTLNHTGENYIWTIRSFILQTCTSYHSCTKEWWIAEVFFRYTSHSWLFLNINFIFL